MKVIDALGLAWTKVLSPDFRPAIRPTLSPRYLVSEGLRLRLPS